MTGTFEYCKDGSLYLLPENKGGIGGIPWTGRIARPSGNIVCGGLLTFTHEGDDPRSKLSSITNMVIISPLNFDEPKNVNLGGLS